MIKLLQNLHSGFASLPKKQHGGTVGVSMIGVLQEQDLIEQSENVGVQLLSPRLFNLLTGRSSSNCKVNGVEQFDQVPQKVADELKPEFMKLFRLLNEKDFNISFMAPILFNVNGSFLTELLLPQIISNALVDLPEKFQINLAFAAYCGPKMFDVMNQVQKITKRKQMIPISTERDPAGQLMFTPQLSLAAFESRQEKKLSDIMVDMVQNFLQMAKDGIGEQRVLPKCLDFFIYLRGVNQNQSSIRVIMPIMRANEAHIYQQLYQKNYQWEALDSLFAEFDLTNSDESDRLFQLGLVLKGGGFFENTIPLQYQSSTTECRDLQRNQQDRFKNLQKSADFKQKLAQMSRSLNSKMLRVWLHFWDLFSYLQRDNLKTPLCQNLFDIFINRLSFCVGFLFIPKKCSFPFVMLQAALSLVMGAAAGECIVLPDTRLSCIVAAARAPFVLAEAGLMIRDLSVQTHIDRVLQFGTSNIPYDKAIRPAYMIAGDLGLKAPEPEQVIKLKTDGTLDLDFKSLDQQIEKLQFQIQTVEQDIEARKAFKMQTDDIKRQIAEQQFKQPEWEFQANDPGQTFEVQVIEISNDFELNLLQEQVLLISKENDKFELLNAQIKSKVAQGRNVVSNQVNNKEIQLQYLERMRQKKKDQLEAELVVKLKQVRDQLSRMQMK